MQGASVPNRITLLPAASSATGSAVDVPAGNYNWVAFGTWNSATAQLQWSPNGGTTWIDVDGASVTSNGGFTDIPISTGVCRVSISGGTPSLTSYLHGVS